MIPLKGEAEQAGANTIRNLPQTPAIVSAITALGSRGKSLLRKPDRIKQEIEQALLNSRSPSEALGKVGMEQAKRRQGITTDKHYIDRYHGPDDLARDKKGKLTEIEAKGNNKDSHAVAKNISMEKQSSKKKNKRRAELMINQKQKKINLHLTGKVEPIQLKKLIYGKKLNLGRVKSVIYRPIPIPKPGGYKYWSGIVLVILQQY